MDKKKTYGCEPHTSPLVNYELGVVRVMRDMHVIRFVRLGPISRYGRYS